jgi:SAM-dependent methyltransferase
VLDVGCGVGRLLIELLERGHDAWGIDVSAPIIKAARCQLQRAGLDQDRVSARPLAELVAGGATWDNVVSMDCLEHVENDSEMFVQLVHLLRPGGRLVVAVPALSWLFGQRDLDIGHYRRYERAMLEELCSEQPIDILELRFWNALGVLPRFVSERLLGRKLDESFRYGHPTLRKQLLRRGLSAWFATIERWVTPPLGLTLILTAERRP